MSRATEEVREQTLKDFHNRRLEGRRLFAEAWGTFLLVLVAAGGKIVSHQNPALPPALASMAPGAIVMAVIYFMGAVSGAHINPAVTFAFALRGNFPWYRVPGYVIAQLSGAVLAALFLRAVVADSSYLGPTEYHLSVGRTLALEVLLTTGLVNTILGTASGARNIGTNGAIAVGGYIALSGLWADPLTGASMNPARSLGPDLVRRHLSDSWIYVIAPLCGACIGVFFEWILKGPPTAEGTLAAQGHDLQEESGGH